MIPHKKKAAFIINAAFFCEYVNAI